ncbi:unnamed protein product [Polarella glacialis]|uniref:Uncharacterized protein n=1 Tax=Polarella glacialis TaxID=89957 RepID=A0A813JPJ2_POLGL|nr:unnamed protein product [Polarella glacialis]
MTVLDVLLRRLPSAGRLLKVTLVVKAPVQPQGLLQDSTSSSSGSPLGGATRFARQRQRWWWHSKVGRGDAIVLDELRCQHSPLVLPGEEALHRARKAAQQLRSALLAYLPLLNRPSAASNSEGAAAIKGLPHALRVCAGLEADILDPAPYPVLLDIYCYYYVYFTSS